MVMGGLWLLWAILVGFNWWWWKFWWWPIPPIPNPPDPPPIDRLRPLVWIAQIAGAVGGGAAWALLGSRLAPDAGLIPVTVIALVGATTLGSIAVNVVGFSPAKVVAR
jgi:hypothetical protein